MSSTARQTFDAYRQRGYLVADIADEANASIAFHEEGLAAARALLDECNSKRTRAEVAEQNRRTVIGHTQRSDDVLRDYPNSTVVHSSPCDRVSAADACIGGCPIFAD